LSGRGLCDELITRPEESYRLCCVVVCDLETSRMGAPYIYDVSRLRVNSCCSEKSTMRSPCICELQVTVNNIKLLSVSENCFSGNLMSPPVKFVFKSSCKMQDIFVPNLIKIGTFIHVLIEVPSTKLHGKFDLWERH